MLSVPELRSSIQHSLADFSSLPFETAALNFWKTLGYSSELRYPDLPSDAAGFADAFSIGSTLRAEKARAELWKNIHFLFQLTDEEIQSQNSLFGQSVDKERHDSYLFFALELKAGQHSRSTLAQIARELNRPFGSPILLLIKNGSTLSLAVVDRRDNKKDASREVLEKVTLIHDIKIADPHAAHLRILQELQLANLRATNWQNLHNEWKRVLDLSELNKKFYSDYKTVFELAERAAVLPAALEDKRRDWTQRLFNRLLFLRFLERKGWLEFNGDNNYLRALFAASQKAGETDFLNDRLFYAFFFGLGFVDEQTHFHSDEKLQRLRGKVPYLNGGLFEQLADSDVQGRASLPNEAFAAILELFDRYYFTVDESTPFDQEVGIDPEMLGKVFEELVTGRHESGSYYTPRGIVSFMGREALKGYLEQFDTAEAVSKLVDGGDGTAVSDPERILAALREVTICDPACGSGAYLLGMMQELLRLREALFAAKAKDYQSIYKRKLEIIARNLYGVDKDPFAISIAMLRLWLSLIIEFEGATPPPLPNLKYKLESGDSLAAPLGAQLTLDSGLVREFNDLKSDYVKAHHGEKVELESKIEAALARLKVYSSAPEGAHDWRTEFAEVFENGGFDIVLANPPYIRQELIKDQKPQLKKIFGDAFSGTADLYCYFYLRGHELLKDGGQLAFISPNKWFRAAYGAKLRAHFADKAQVRSIVDFGELRVFQTAATFPMVFIAQKVGTRPAVSANVSANVSASSDTAGRVPTTWTQVKSLDEPYPDVRALVLRDGARLPATALNGANWNLSDAQTATRLETMRKSGLPLGDYVKGQIYRGVLTGFNEAFVIDAEKRAELIRADAKSKELIKPMAKGDDVRRWRIEDKKRFLIVTKIGVEIKKYPAIFKHLKQWQPQLEARTDQGNHWWELRACAYYDAFDKPKIHYPEIARESRFTLDKTKIYPIKTVFTIASDELYLLGILNSQSAWEFLKKTCSVLGDEEKGGRLLMSSIFVEQIPIPTAGAKDKSAIEKLVASCLAKRGAECAGEEAEINAIVAKLYGLEGVLRRGGSTPAWREYSGVEGVLRRGGSTPFAANNVRLDRYSSKLFQTQ